MTDYQSAPRDDVSREWVYDDVEKRWYKVAVVKYDYVRLDRKVYKIRVK